MITFSNENHRNHRKNGWLIGETLSADNPETKKK